MSLFGEFTSPAEQDGFSFPKPIESNGNGQRQRSFAGFRSRIAYGGNMKIPELKRGQWLVILVDGTEKPMEGKPTIGLIHREISAECCDSVTLRFPADGKDAIVMICDDTGMVDGKPVNSKATELYHARCKPGTIWAIHGDVAIVNDMDFA